MSAEAVVSAEQPTVASAVGGVTPEPTAEEAVAIVAALQMGLASGAAAEQATEPSRWRFSGRWWSKPVPARRNRP